MVAIILVELVACPLVGQELTKRQLTEADYCLWHSMGSTQLSDRGNWASYRLSYDDGIDTSFVVNTNSLERFTFPDLKEGQFVGEKLFVFGRKEGLVLFDLQLNSEKIYPNVSQYAFSSGGLFLVTLENSNALVIRKDGVEVERVENVTDYVWNNNKTMLACTTSINGENSVAYLVLDKAITRKNILRSNEAFHDLKWQSNSDSMVFYSGADGSVALYYYDLKSEALKVMKATDVSFPKDRRLDFVQNIPLQVSRDGTKVFFGMTNSVPQDSTGFSRNVEVWNANDQLLYRERKMRATVLYPQYLGVWYPRENIVNQISSKERSWVALNGSQDHALVADLVAYEPRYKWFADMDYYLMDVKTLKSELVLKAHSGFGEQLGFSPNGRFISYYKDSNWWVYDISKKTHLNITAGLGVAWDNSTVDSGNELHVWGLAGWTTDGMYLLLHDLNDVWKISADGKQRERLTKGKEKGLQFRLDPSVGIITTESNFSDTGTTTYDLSKPIVLKAFQPYSGANGYYVLKPREEAKALVMQEASTTNYKKAEKSATFIFVQQRFDTSPTLMVEKKGARTVVFESNPQQRKFFWGSSKMIHYEDRKGNRLNGALYLPATYDASKRYPMVVFVYETLSRSVNDYVNPSLYNGVGFSIAKLTADGYAVLLPDIAYEKGNPGFSAVDCVTSAVKKVIDMGVADGRKIGLIGHSFGGYETNFIISQTSLFATAVSGSAVSDNVQHYFTINTDYNTIDGWRYENQQYRMGVPFFEDQERYYRNSPLLNANTINTPLLSWAGSNDGNVRPSQAETFYAALRRLKKEHVMLVYTNERHILQKRKNQEDLTKKISDWLDYYLKDKPKAAWMKRDVEH